MELLDRSPIVRSANIDTRDSNAVNRFQMKERNFSAVSDRNLSISLISSQSNRSPHLRTSRIRRISRQQPTSASASIVTAPTPSSLTLQARQKKVCTDLIKLKLDEDSSEEEIIEKIEITKSSIPSDRLKSIITSKFGIGGAKNKHAAAMNALLRLRPRHLERRGSQEELRKMYSDWMKTLINKVWTIYKFSKIMNTYSSSLLERSARMEAEDVVRSGESQSRDNSNDKPSIPAKFRSLLPPRYRKILYKYPESRTESDISQLRVFLRSSLHEFRQFTEATQIALCMSMHYTCYEKGRVILRQGHPGKNFYIILSGSLVWMRSDIDKETGEVYTCDNVMKTGEKFGEIALIRKTTRTATVVCCEDSELLMVDKDLFDKYCPNLFEEQLREKMLAVKDVHLFEGWSQSDLEEVVLEARLQEFPINRVVVRDSMECPLFYLVVEGKCRVLKEIDVGKLDKRPSLIGQNTNRHFHLSELPPSQYSQLSLSDDDIYRRKDYISINEGAPRIDGIITRDGKAYLQLRQLARGDIFELTEIYKSHLAKTGARGSKLQLNNTQSLMLVSNGAKLLQITKSKFKSKAGASFLDTLHKYFIKYPRDEELIRNYKQQITWILYKRDVVTREMAHQKAKGIKRTEIAKGVFSED